jgi:hypothetical protein
MSSRTLKLFYKTILRETSVSTIRIGLKATNTRRTYSRNSRKSSTAADISHSWPTSTTPANEALCPSAKLSRGSAVLGAVIHTQAHILRHINGTKASDPAA